MKIYCGGFSTASRFNAPLTGYRIADSRFPIFDGTGAALLGGRWNSSGKPVIYGSLSFAGALLEQLARAASNDLPATLHWVSFYVKDELLAESAEPDDVPGWNDNESVAARKYGDEWLASRRSVALIVPSMVGRPVERNVLINPLHPEFASVAVSEQLPVVWDSRLIKSSK